VALRANGAPVVGGSFLGTATLDDTSFDRGADWGTYLVSFGTDGRVDQARIEGGPGLNLFTFPGTLSVLDDGRIAFAGNFQGEVLLGEGTPDEVMLDGVGAWELLFAVYDGNVEFADDS
jgi:hypothetical protein